MAVKRRCGWPVGCTTILSSYNKTGLCGAHQKEKEERLGRVKDRAFLNHIYVPTKWSKGSKKQPIPRLQNTSVTPSHSTKVTVDELLKIICDSYGVTVEELLTHRRYQGVAFPRQVAMYLLRVDFQMSFSEIAACIKRQHHTTVLYGFRQIQGLMARDPRLIKDIESIRSKYKSPA